MDERKNDWWRRGTRTLMQFVVGSGFTALLDQLVLDFPDRYDAYVIILGGLIASYAQNWLEDHTKMPAPLKQKPSAGVHPVPGE